MAKQLQELVDAGALSNTDLLLLKQGSSDRKIALSDFVEDSTTSTDPRKALSANQGKLLQDAVDAAPYKAAMGQSIFGGGFQSFLINRTVYFTNLTGGDESFSLNNFDSAYAGQEFAVMIRPTDNVNKVTFTGPTPLNVYGGDGLPELRPGESANFLSTGDIPNSVEMYKWSLSSATTVIDNLLSTSAVDALSANQGKILSEAIGAGAPPAVVLTTTPVVLTTTALNNRVLFDSGSSECSLDQSLGVDGDTITFINNGATPESRVNATGGNFSFSFGISTRYASAASIFNRSQTVVFTKRFGVWFSLPSALLRSWPMITLGNGTEVERQYRADEVDSAQRINLDAGTSTFKMGDFGVADLGDDVSGSSAITYLVHPTDNCTVTFHADKVGDSLFFLGSATNNFVMTGGVAYKVLIERLQGKNWYVTIT